MRGLFLSIALIAALGIVSVAVAGCTAAAPAPTQAPPPPTKAAAEPTKASAAAPVSPTVPVASPTAAPPKVDFPTKGKAITIIVGFAAGGPVDLSARLLAPYLEKELGTPVNVINRAGAASQIGATEVAAAKPDGYTIGSILLPSVPLLYMDPERKATFDRKSFQPLATHVREAGALTVKADSPFKDLKDLVQAAKAEPEKIQIGTAGLLGANHMNVLRFEELAGVKFASVHFDGSGPSMTAVLGGHVHAASAYVSSATVGPVKSGQARILGIMDKQENRNLPGVKTFEAQGYPLHSYIAYTYVLPAGTPKEIVDILSKAMEKSIGNEEHRKKMEEASLTVSYMGPADLGAYWEQEEKWLKPLMEKGLQHR